ncbi:DUF6491 family protein [Agaribacterium haliotis]|uniref:DUF6491 family protein n=1 Tax=Agaribacterium haliotis TaxID=2013869 RepID=UPI000BB5795E|nr:DUF6491 family protein [Agaribacterium haliotis]
MNTKRAVKAALTSALALGLSFNLGACSSSGSSKTSSQQLAMALAEQTGQNGRACIRTSDIRGYGMDGQNQINIDARPKYYIATTLYTCQNIDLAPRALFDSRFSEACGGSTYITTRNGRCPIDKIFEFANRDEAFTAVRQAKETIEKQKGDSK